jgi:hypothetical protein
MGFFYFDESIHERAGFILGAFVYSEADLSKPVAEALSSLGLQPGVDEFKSGDRVSDRERRSALRYLLRLEMQDTRLGIVVTSTQERRRLGNEALIGLSRITEVNELGREHAVYVDQGIRFERRGDTLATFETATGSRCYLEKDSRVVGGLQVADLAAHSLATMVLETMGLVSKKVRLGYEDEGVELGIGFELWLTTRRCLFQCHGAAQAMTERDGYAALTADTSTYALHISHGCPPEVRTAAVDRLGTMYLGCVH